MLALLRLPLTLGHINDYENFVMPKPVENPTSQWHYISATRVGDTCYMFCDGQLRGSAKAKSSHLFDMSAGRPVLVGHDGFQGNAWLNAYVDDLCLIADKGLWTSDFTPPTGYLLDRYQIYCKDDAVYGMQ